MLLQSETPPTIGVYRISVQSFMKICTTGTKEKNKTSNSKRKCVLSTKTKE